MKNELQPTSKDLLLAELNKLNRPDWWESPWVFGGSIAVLAALIIGTGAGSQVLNAANAQGERRAERTEQYQNIQEAEQSLEDMRVLDEIARSRMHAAFMPVSAGNRSKYIYISEETQLMDPENANAPLSDRLIIDPAGMTALTDKNGYPTQLAQIMWEPGEQREWLREELSENDYRAVVSNMASGGGAE